VIPLRDPGVGTCHLCQLERVLKDIDEQARRRVEPRQGLRGGQPLEPTMSDEARDDAPFFCSHAGPFVRYGRDGVNSISCARQNATNVSLR
jgi:hypothetical protein